MRLKLIASSVLVMAAAVASAQNINGAGATFPYPIYSKWFSEYSQAHSNIKINYQSIGSGGRHSPGLRGYGRLRRYRRSDDR